MENVKFFIYLGKMAVNFSNRTQPAKSDLLQQVKKEFERRRRWHQAKAFQQTARHTRTEGSPFKTHLAGASRGTLRRPPLLNPQSDNEKEQVETGRTASTPYRLPRLAEKRIAAEKSKDYVYKQPLTATHFLIRKDPKRSTPVPDCTSPDLRIKPNSTKCRPITQSVRRNVLYQTWPPQDGAKMHRLLPKLSQPNGVIVLTDGQSVEPKTPPQSEAEYGLLPTLANPSRQPTAASSQIQHNLAPLMTDNDNVAERKLHWQLSPYSNNNFDRQGLGPNQGPFSREMPIKCTPPSNWLRMKLRQRIVGK